jgi:hypothetical protein
MLGITADLHTVVVWVTSQFSGSLNCWWLNRKQHVAIPYSLDYVVVEIRKTSLHPYIRDDAINATLGPTQESPSYATYTQLFYDFLRRSRQPLTDNLQCVRFIIDLADFQWHSEVKSHRSQ